MANTTEEALSDSVLENIHGAAAEGAELVGESAEADPRAIAEAVDRFLAKPKRGGWFSKVDNWDDRALPIGSLWGVAMSRQFGWRWATLTQHDHDEFEAMAVVSPDAALAIFPFHYCFGCLENKVPPTILLAFNMLGSGDIPQHEPDSYVNLMDGVHHIVPPQ